MSDQANLTIRTNVSIDVTNAASIMMVLMSFAIPAILSMTLDSIGGLQRLKMGEFASRPCGDRANCEHHRCFVRIQ